MSSLKNKFYEIIFEADTKAGKTFDIILSIVILVSVLLVMLESVQHINARYNRFLKIAEWFITIIFTIEYIIRIIIVKKAWRYITSFYGIIDLMAVIPTYLSLVFIGGQSLVVIRILRLLRVFRILKLSRYSAAGRSLAKALWSSRAKIGVFLFFVFMLVVIIGTIMYLIEGEENGFKSIPLSIYWAIVTLTTVGYGDISPSTATGQFLASIVMIMGYAIIAVPTGIVTAEIIGPFKKNNTQVCPECLHSFHDDDAIYCKKCGSEINPEEDN